MGGVGDAIDAVVMPPTPSRHATARALAFDDHGARFTPVGIALFAELGIAYEPVARRPLCRACPDWSERRWHIAGSVGAALCRHALESEWVRRRAGTRARGKHEARRNVVLAGFLVAPGVGLEPTTRLLTVSRARPRWVGRKSFHLGWLGPPW